MKSSLISLSLAYAFAKVREFPQLAPHAARPPASESTRGSLDISTLDAPNTSTRDGFALVSDPEGEAAQRYRDFVDEMLGRAWPRKRMLVTSPASGEGKTLTAVNLALTLAERGLTVFLVELTLTRPRYRYVFGAPDSLRGVESVLRGEASPEEAALQLGQTRIAVTSVAKPMANNDLLGEGENLRRLIEYGESTCDWTVLDMPSVFDAPSVDGGTAIKELAAQAGPVVMVARSGKTKLDVFRKAADTLGPDLDYVILNDIAS
jgi:Mrp family chromosome partitioning ATPase